MTGSPCPRPTTGARARTTSRRSGFPCSAAGCSTSTTGTRPRRSWCLSRGLADATGATATPSASGSRTTRERPGGRWWGSWATCATPASTRRPRTPCTFPSCQFPGFSYSYFVRTVGDPLVLAHGLRQAVYALDPQTAVAERPDPGAGPARVDRLAASHRRAARLVRHPGARHHRRRPLRAHRLHGEPEDARDRHPHGARRRLVAGRGHAPPPGPLVGRDRPRPGRGRSAGPHPSRLGDAVRGGPDGHRLLRRLGQRAGGRSRPWPAGGPPGGPRASTPRSRCGASSAPAAVLRRVRRGFEPGPRHAP